MPTGDRGRVPPECRPLSFPRNEKSKIMGSGGSTVARLKLKGIDGMVPQGVECAA